MASIKGEVFMSSLTLDGEFHICNIETPVELGRDVHEHHIEQARQQVKERFAKGLPLQGWAPQFTDEVAT